MGARSESNGVAMSVREQFALLMVLVLARDPTMGAEAVPARIATVNYAALSWGDTVLPRAMWCQSTEGSCSGDWSFKRDLTPASCRAS